MSVGESQSLGFGPEKAGQNSAWSVSRETYCVVRMLLSEWLWWCSICFRTCIITIFIFAKTNYKKVRTVLKCRKTYNSIVISVAGGLYFRCFGWTRKWGASPHAAGTVSVEAVCCWRKPVIGKFLRRQTGCCLRHKSEDLQRYGIIAMVDRIIAESWTT